MYLPNNEYKFYFKEKCKVTGESFEGDFTVKCVLNIEEQIRVSILVDRYNGNSTTIDPSHALVNRAIAELEVRIKKDDNGNPLCPTWWVDSDYGRTLYDRDLVYRVLNQALEGQKQWQDRLNKEAKKSEVEAKKSDKIRADREEKLEKAEASA